jgi:hypothetical protein
VAVPLTHNGKTNYLVLEYKGEEYYRFTHLVKHLFNTMKIKNYHIYEGKDEEKIQVFIEVDNITIEDAQERLEELSENLKQKLSKKWKCLPTATLPDSYNIVTLPYKKI